MKQRLTFVLGVSILLLAAKSVSLAQQWYPDRKASFVVKSVEAKSADLGVPKITIEEGNAAIYVEGPLLFRRANGTTSKAKLEDLKPNVKVRAYGAGEATRGFHASKILILLKE